MENYSYIKGNSHVLIHAPHGGTVITDFAFQSLAIGEDELQSEILAMTDAHTGILSLDVRDAIYAFGQKDVVNVFKNNLSRLVVDPERFPDEREEMNAVGMGAMYTHGSQRQRIRLDDDITELHMLKAYFFTYAFDLQNEVTNLLAQHDKATIVDMHSYASKALPYELHQTDERPEICIGVDPYHTEEWQTEAITRIFGAYGYQTKVNSPFTGTYVPLAYYGKDKRVSSVMFEIRRDMYMNELTGEIEDEKYTHLTNTIADVIDALIV